MQEKIIYTEDNFSFDAIQVGDLVEQAVVDGFMNMLPPVSMRYDCAQIGEPYSHKLDTRSGKYRPTFQTFRCIGNRTWMYCGACFCGENVERGEGLPYVRAAR